jgi:hypothetical protein
VICVIVEICVAPDDLAQLADDADNVYGEIFRTVPGFLYGSLGVREQDNAAVGVMYFESADAWQAAEPVMEGVREAVGISPGATFTLVEYDVIVRRVGFEPSRLFPPLEGTPAPGAPA